MKKIIALLFALLIPATGLAQNHTINSNLKVEGSIVGGLKVPGLLVNLNIKNATTTNTDDSIKIECGGAACSSSNPGFVTLKSGATPGNLVTYKVTSDITFDLTGAHFGAGTKGDVAGMILRVNAVDHNGSLGWCITYQGGFNYLTTTQDSTTPTDINLPEEALCNIAITSASNTMTEVAWFRTNFDDTGGAAEDLHTVQSGVGDLNTNQIADGYWWDFNASPSGFSSLTTDSSRCMQVRKTVFCEIFFDGTSDSTSLGMTLPIKSDSNMVATNNHTMARANDNGSALADPARIDVPAGTATGTFIKSLAGGTWTNINNKAVRGTFNYPAYQP